MKVKICGITNLDDARAAIEAGADALGFVFALEAKSRGRYIEPDAAQEIIAKLPPFVLTVAVCVNETQERLEQYLRFTDRVQLCGEEDPSLCKGLGSRAIKSLRVGPAFSLDQLAVYAPTACLLDTFRPGVHGGAGEIFDWRVARAAVECGYSIVLAGGLNPENVAAAIQAVRPDAVDVSSGVEKAPGRKDHERMREFIRQAKLPLS